MTSMRPILPHAGTCPAPVEFAGCPPPPRAPSPTSSAAGPTSSSPRCWRRAPTWPRPAPHDSSQLAARVVVKASVLRALDALDALELAVLQALVQDTDPADLAAAPDAVAPGAGAAADAGPGLGHARPARSSSSATCCGCPPGPPADEVAGLLERARPAGARDPRPPRRDRRRRSLERRRRARRPTWSPPACWSHVDERHVTLPWSVRLALRRRGRRLDEPPDAGHLRARAVAGRPGRGRRRLRARTPHRAAPRPVGHPPAGRAEGRRARRTRPARGRRPCSTSSPTSPRWSIETALRGRPARPGHDRRPRRGLAADRRLRRAGSSASTAAALGHPGRAPGSPTRAWSRRSAAAIGDKPVNALSPDLARSWLVELRRDVLARAGRPPAPTPSLAAGTGVASLVAAAALAAPAPPGRPPRPGRPAARRGSAARHHRAGRLSSLRPAR